MSDEYIARLASSAADESKFLQDWRSGIPDYHAPTLDPECAFWEVEHPKRLSPCTITGSPRFYPLRLRGQPNGPVAAVHTDLLFVADLYGIQLNRLHSFMQYLPVKCVIRTLLIQLERVPRPPGGGIPCDLDWVDADMNERLGQPVLGEMIPDGPGYTQRCVSSCLRKLMALHRQACSFWDFCHGIRLVDLLTAVINLHEAAWQAYRPWAAPGTTVEDWIFWTRLSDPWVSGAHEFVLESRPMHEYWPTKPVPETKRSRTTTPPWGVWKPTAVELAAMRDEALGLAVTVPALPSAPTERLWEFEQILDSRWQGKGRNRKVWFLVQWKDFEATWQPEDDLRGCCEQWLLMYYEKCPGAAGPPKWLMA